MRQSYQETIKGTHVTFTFRGPRAVPFSKVTAVTAIPFTENGDIVAVRLRHRGIDLPGGHVEAIEATPDQTLQREVMEEACMTVRNPILAEVIESDYFEDPSYMLLYGCFVDSLSEFVPNDESIERVTVSIDGFIDQYEAGDKSLMKQAITRAWALLNT